MSADSANFQYLRLPSDPFGASLGGLFWLGVALMCGWLALGAMFSTQPVWLEYQDPALAPKLLLDSATILNAYHPTSSAASWLPPQMLVDVGIWLFGRAFPLLLWLIAGVALRRAWQFYRHRHGQSAHAWMLQKASALLLTMLFVSGFAVWNQVPFGSGVPAPLPGMSGGLLGNEVVSLLRYALHEYHVLITLILIAGTMVSGFWLFDLGMFALCEKIGWLWEYFHQKQYRKNGEAHDRSLGQVIAQLREQTVSLDKLAAAENTVRIVRQPVAAPKMVPPSHPQNLFGAVAELVPPGSAMSPPTKRPPAFTPPNGAASQATSPHSAASPSTENPFSAQQTTALRHREPLRHPTAAFRIISRPNDAASQSLPPSPAKASPTAATANLTRQPAPTPLQTTAMTAPVPQTRANDMIPPAVNRPPTPPPVNAEMSSLPPPPPQSATTAFSNTYLLSSLLKQGDPKTENVADFEKTLLLSNDQVLAATSVGQKPTTPAPANISPVLAPANPTQAASSFDLSLILPKVASESLASAPPAREMAPPERPAAALPPFQAATVDDAEIEEHDVNEGDDAEERADNDKSPQYASWSHFPLPPLSLLDTTPPVGEPPNDEVIRLVSGQIESALKSFGVTVEVKAAYPGPVITRYEIQLASGVKGAQIVNLSKDLARTLAVMSIRVVENIPGKPWMGLEVPNERRQMVKLAEIISSADFQNETSPLTMAIGKDISGVPKSLNLGAMPHLLVAGTTGSGKSVGLNDMILSMLFKATPNEVRMVMIDPKMVELSVYADIPHLIAPVITDMKQAVGALNWCVQEMERREQLLSKLSVRNIAKFNQRVMEARDKGKPLLDPIEKERLEEMGAEDFSSVPTLSPIPYLVVIVDEFADLFMVIGKKIEEVIARIAAKGRAGGIHLILATQRPSVDVVTGLIKANVPSRIAFQVSSKIDSRTILDQQGAEALLGQGDMLYSRPGIPVQRFHGAFVSDDEVNAVADYLRSVAPPKYLVRTFEDPAEEGSGKVGTGLTSGNNGQNEYDMAVQTIMESPNPSISYLQRRMEIGFNKAAKYIEQMENDGILSAPQKNGKRTVISPRHDV